MNACCETPAFEPPAAPPREGALQTVVLIGPPNSGKSTLFNRLTGLRQKVANYPGVTVEQRHGIDGRGGARRPDADRSAGNLLADSVLRRCARGRECAARAHAGHAQAGRGSAGAGLAAPDAATDAGRAGAGGGAADAGAAEHERPDGVARRADRHAEAGARAGRAGGADQRRAWNWPGCGAAVSESAERARREGQAAGAAGDGQRGQHA